MLKSGVGGTLEWLLIKDLKVVWPNSQRPLSDKRVKSLVDAFDADLFDPPHVTGVVKEPDIRHVIDGHHRVNVAEQRFGLDHKIPCIVHKDCKTEAHAARIFRQINSSTARKSPTAVENFKVAVTEGSAVHVEIDAVVSAAGYHITSAHIVKGISAVQALVTVHAKYGVKVLKDTLMVIRTTWNQDPNATDAPIILGYGAFLFAYPKANIARLKDRIAKRFTPGQLLVAAKAAKQASNKPLGHEVKQVLYNYYNTGRMSANDKLNDDSFDNNSYMQH